ncbi:MAG: hypothetical protein GXO48_03260 [Chlorobi bacterium]|nr:hypothetical protein [Chlorobiota bacterium]
MRQIPTHLKPMPRGHCEYTETSWLNNLLRNSSFTPWMVYLPIVGILLTLSFIKLEFSLPLVVGLFLLGWFTWTITEYILHRFVLHAEPKNPVLRKMLDIAHWQHHRHPKDDQCFEIPVLFSALLALLVFSVFYFLMGPKSIPFYAGFAFGYLFYVMMHWAQHFIAMKQVPDFLKPLWEHHLLHHYKNPDSNFGVTFDFWDRVFGTRETREERK